MKQPRSEKSVFFQAWDQERWIQIAFFAVVVAIGVASRFWLLDWPNVKPVAALVLFSAFFFHRSSIALLALVLIMAISDLSIGVYDWRLMTSVYLSLAVSAGLGCWVKSSVGQSARTRMGAGQVGRFAIASLVMSTVFFALTNGVVWWFGQWYPASWSGLASCYAAGSALHGHFGGWLLGNGCNLYSSSSLARQNRRCHFRFVSACGLAAK
jgi:hypothetical protein